MNTHLEPLVETHLRILVDEIGARPTGSPGNQRAGAYLKETFANRGWKVEALPFDCLTWEEEGCRLNCATQSFKVQVNPYSPAFEGQFPFIVCDSVDVIEQHNSLRDHIVVLAGKLSEEMYMPLNFPFFTAEDQQHILRQLITRQPEAVIGINNRPLFCDGDFPLPSVTLDPADAPHLQACRDQLLTLSIQSRRIESSGYNVIARAVNSSQPKVVISAHYDTWFNTPGAVDNATGVTVLLTLAHLLDPQISNVEFVVFNGEDHYAAPGEVSYLAGGLGGIAYNINIDGVGAMEHQPSIAYLGDSPPIFDIISAVQQEFPNVVTAAPWYQGDHTLFVQQGIPAVALTSSPLDAWLERTHTPMDTLEGVNVAHVIEVVRFIQQILTR